MTGFKTPMSFDIRHANFYYMGIILFLSACTGGIKVSELKEGLAEDNVLRYNIEFHTDVSATAQIVYWSEGEESDDRVSRVSMKAAHHRFTLIGMTANTAYHYKIMTGYKEDSLWKESFRGNFKTGELPDSLPRLNLEVNQGDVFNGYILARQVVAPGSTVLIDQEGNIVWYDIRGEIVMKPFSWTRSNTVISLDDPKTIYEFDLYDKQISHNIEREMLGADMHHEIKRLANNDILALTHKFSKIDLSTVGGLVIDSIKADGLVRLDSSGMLRWSWNILDFADPLADENILKAKKDWGHANSVSITSDGNYLVSFRDFNQIWKIAAATGEVLWKLGLEGDFHLDSLSLFYQQHAVQEVAPNTLLFFDNGNLNRRTSRALIMALDESNMQLLTARSVFLPDSLFSFKQGSVYKIKGNKFLFCATTKNKIIVTDEEANVLWQLHSSEPHYRAYYLEELPAMAE